MIDKLHPVRKGKGEIINSILITKWKLGENYRTVTQVYRLSPLPLTGLAVFRNFQVLTDKSVAR
ncbi:MAG: hypothetical protein ABEJ25_00165 [Candidatus Bipolaricaulia bacterium]